MTGFLISTFFSFSLGLSALACQWELGDVAARDADEDLRAITRMHRLKPAIYYSGGSYGAVPAGVPLFRGVTGPDHALESVLRFLNGDQRHELMSPSFRRAYESALRSNSFAHAYAIARRETVREIRESIAAFGLKDFAAQSTAGSSTGLAFDQKRGAIVKFTNSINDALIYAVAAFERNLSQGRCLNPVIFDVSGQGVPSQQHDDSFGGLIPS